jgi:hypothetical protein
MDDPLQLAAEAIERALEVLARHAAREHRRCDGCVDVAALLIAAQEDVESAREGYRANDTLFVSSDSAT